MGRITDEELRIAKSVDLVDLAGSVNIPLKRVGNYFSIEGMDSTMIFNRATWCRFSRGVGGSTIDFLMYFKDMEYREAVSYLLDYAGYIKLDTPVSPSVQRKKQKEPQGRPKEKEKVPFVLPKRSKNCRGLYAYLMKRRKLSQGIVDHWLKKDLLYESEPYHNIVFLGKDANGKVKFASQRGIRDMYGKPFKGDVPGNDKRYGVNMIDPKSEEINIFEAAIDAMSDMDFRQDYETSILALGMVSDGPLQTILQEQKQIRRLNLCLDNDVPGRLAAKKLARKYVLDGYEVFVRLPPLGKDYNSFLQYERENRDLYKQLEHSGRKPKSDLKEPERAEKTKRNTRFLEKGGLEKIQDFTGRRYAASKRAVSAR